MQKLRTGVIVSTEINAEISFRNSRENRRERGRLHPLSCTLWLIYFQMYKWVNRNGCLIANIYYLYTFPPLKTGQKSLAHADFVKCVTPISAVHGVCSDGNLKASYCTLHTMLQYCYYSVVHPVWSFSRIKWKKCIALFVFLPMFLWSDWKSIPWIIKWGMHAISENSLHRKNPENRPNWCIILNLRHLIQVEQKIINTRHLQRIVLITPWTTE